MGSFVSMTAQTRYIVSDLGILGGTPVFAGSRVPFGYLMQYLERGSTIEQFIVDYPSVTKELAMKALEEAASMIEESIHAHSAG
jgi:uncharacterized protein (DUF433 family)